MPNRYQALGAFYQRCVSLLVRRHVSVVAVSVVQLVGSMIAWRRPVVGFVGGAFGCDAPMMHCRIPYQVPPELGRTAPSTSTRIQCESTFPDCQTRAFSLDLRTHTHTHSGASERDGAEERALRDVPSNHEWHMSSHAKNTTNTTPSSIADTLARCTMVTNTKNCTNIKA
jgi:hypothetical protein